MLSLAQISLNNELWGKARSYLEACIECGGTVEAYRELGHLLEQLDEKDTALDLYQARHRSGHSPGRNASLPHQRFRRIPQILADQTHTILDSETR